MKKLLPYALFVFIAAVRPGVAAPGLPAFSSVATKATPAVVSIVALKAAPSRGDDQDPLFDGNPFESPAPPSGPGFGHGHESMGMGSGVLIRSDGIILTNNHVVEDAERVTVSLDEKHKYDARIIGVDTKTDIAVIKIEKAPNKLPTIEFGNSDAVKVGDWAVAIGCPFGLTQTVTSGIISAKGRGHMGVFDIEDFIQTDAPINPGNSGGPLLNLDGKMIGLNAAIFSQTGGFVGIGFAIPSNLVQEVTNDIITHGRVIRGWIGISAQDVDEDLAKYFHVPAPKGALVSTVAPGGPANKAGVQPGDVITKFSSAPIDSSTELRLAVSKTKAGSDVPLTIVRKGETKQLTLTVREQKQASVHPVQMAGRMAKKDGDPLLGLTLQDVPADLARFLKLPSHSGALVIDVRAGSPGFDAGLSPGDIILKANENAINTAKDFRDFAKDREDRKNTVLYVQRGPDKRLFVPVKAAG